MNLSREGLMAIFERRRGRPVALNEVMDELGAPRSCRQMVWSALLALVREGGLVRLRKNYCILPASGGRREQGELHVSARGRGYLLGPDKLSEDIVIDSSNLATALDGDTVEVEVFPGRRRGREEGRVVRVVRRAHERIVGQFSRTGAGAGAVTPRNVRVGRMIEVRNIAPDAAPANGAWVLVRVVRWSRDVEEPLVAEIEEVIGRPGERGISVLVLLRDMGIDPQFPAAVRRQAGRFRPPASARELARRRDLRGETVFTIDPATAKDFDDALSVQPLEGGNWRLGVHIADVAQYVRAGAPLDAEALRRGTSIYPVDRVVAMLPERLSNDLCSLRPGEDRYALSCFMEINPAGEVLDYEIGESVICSRHRLNYREVQEFFDQADRKKSTKRLRFADVGKDLLALRELARALNRMRMQRGALDLDLPEKKITCNDHGDTIAVERCERLESHRLVEECMLIANETVARHLKKHKLPALYRIHDYPDPGALERLAPALALFGLQTPRKAKPSPAVYQSLVERLGRADGGHIGQRLLLRSLMRAEYRPVNRGHFGLASACYCHFTSPIRRYPDLLVHRVLKAWLRGEPAPYAAHPAKGEDAPPQDSPDSGAPSTLEAIANQSNLTAERAEEVERLAADVKSMEFMKDQEGGIFEGWISGIVRRGFFVELLEFPVEGYVDARTIEGDQFRADEDGVRLVGRFTRRSYRLAQRVRVRVVRVNQVEGEMDLELVESRRRTAGKAGHTKKRRRKK